MVETARQMEPLDRARVERVMRAALASPDAQLDQWRAEPLGYLNVRPGRRLVRVTGWAREANGRRVAWSAVAKVVRANDSREGVDSQREIQVYRSSMLRDVPGRLRPPRLYAIEDEADGATWLWLEDVRDLYARDWPLSQFGVAARHLGAFNGVFVSSRGVPADGWLNPWLDRHWADGHAELARIPAYWLDLERVLQSHAVQQAFGARIGGRARQLLADQAEFVDVLSRLPQTLCHHDAALANLFAVRDARGGLETVAVDWEKLGPGPIGAEIATLVFGTLRRCEFDAERAAELEDIVFHGYVSGLRAAGCQGPVEQVRLGYAAAIALRWSVLAETLRLLRDGAQPVRTSQGRTIAPDRLLAQRILLSELLLSRADEARRLAACEAVNPTGGS